MVAVAHNMTLTNALRETSNKYTGWASHAGGLVSMKGDAEGLFVESPLNFVPNSDDCSAASWTASGLTVSGTLYENPTGRLTANRVTAVSNGDYLQAALGTIPTGTNKVSLYLKNATGGTISIIAGDDGGSSTPDQVTMTSTWQRFDISYNFTDGDNAFIKISSEAGDTATQFDIAMVMLNLGSVLQDFQPSQKDFASMFAAITAGATVQMISSSDTDTATRYEFDAKLSDLKRSHPMNQNITYSFSFASTGEVTPTEI
jgi:hypothetical protein